MYVLQKLFFAIIFILSILKRKKQIGKNDNNKSAFLSSIFVLPISLYSIVYNLLQRGEEDPATGNCKRIYKNNCNTPFEKKVKMGLNHILCNGKHICGQKFEL